MEHELDELSDEIQNDSDKNSRVLYEDEALTITSITLKDLKLPASVYTIAVTAGFYFLSEVGINSVLTVYLIELLRLDPNVAISVVLIYRCLTANLSIVVAFLADNFFGRFSTIIFGSIVYLIAVSVFASMSIPFMSLARWMIYLALVLRGVGSACFLAAMVPFANDQMKMRTFIPPKNVQTFYFFVVWSASFLDFLSVILSTFLKQGLHCFGRENCYPASFAYCTVNTILGFSVFLFGLSTYVLVKPVKAVMAKAPFVILYALRTRRKNKERKEEHWLDYAKDKYDPVYVDELKEVIKVILAQMFMFWTLLHQRYTLWTVQAMRLSRRLGGLQVSAEQVVAMYPFFVIIISPAYFFFGRPLLTKYIKAPLMQMTLAGFLISCAFCMSAVLSSVIETDEVTRLEAGSIRATFINSRNCAVVITDNFDLDSSLEPFSFKTFILAKDRYENATIKFSCSNEETGTYQMQTNHKDEDYYYLITDVGKIAELPNFKNLKDNSASGTLLYCICDPVSRNRNVVLTIDSYEEKQNYKPCESSLGVELNMVPGDNYAFSLNNVPAVDSFSMDYGDVVVMLIHSNDKSILILKIMRVLYSNKWSFLWMIPQYLLLSIGAIIFMLAVFVFQYNETPSSCTALVWSLKHFNSGIDSFAMATSSLLVSLSVVLFLWSLAGFIYTMIFGLLTRNYKYRYSSDNSSTAIRVKSKVRTFLYN